MQRLPPGRAWGLPTDFRLLPSIEAAERRIDDDCIKPPRKFQQEAMRRLIYGKEMFLQEVEVEITPDISHHRDVMSRLAEALAGVLAGELPLDLVVQKMAPLMHHFHQLSTVYLSGGSDDWGLSEAMAAFTQLPALHHLLVRFRYDTEAPPKDLSERCSAMRGGLRHLSLIMPARSALPPMVELAQGLSELTQLTTLKLRRVPMERIPTWLGNLKRLQHLYWDPHLPSDVANVLPPGLSTLTCLRSLWAETAMPLMLPTSLTNLENLQLTCKGFHGPEPDGDEQQAEEVWNWLRPLHLHSLRLQGAGLRRLPESVQSLSQLTRLSLMCNKLRDLPVGPYLRNLQCIHLGANRLARFPSTLTQASHLRVVFLANQMPDDHAKAYTSRMLLTGSDVSGLLNLQNLEMIIIGQLQPNVRVGGHHHDFHWLARLLKKRAGVKLTSEELLYPFENKEVFDIKQTEHVERAPNLAG